MSESPPPSSLSDEDEDDDSDDSDDSDDDRKKKKRKRAQKKKLAKKKAKKEKKPTTPPLVIPEDPHHPMRRRQYVRSRAAASVAGRQSVAAAAPNPIIAAPAAAGRLPHFHPSATPSDLTLLLAAAYRDARHDDGHHRISQAMKNVPKYEPGKRTASTHITAFEDTMQLLGVKTSSWPHLLAHTLPAETELAEKMRQYIKKCGKLSQDNPKRDPERMYGKLCKLFRERYDPSQLERDATLDTLNTIKKTADQPWEKFVDQFELLWSKAHRDHQDRFNDTQEKIRLCLAATEADVKRHWAQGAYSLDRKLQWRAFVAIMTRIYLQVRDPDASLKYAAEQFALAQAQQQILAQGNSSQANSFTRGVSRAYRDAEGAERKQDWYAAHPEVPVPLLPENQRMLENRLRTDKASKDSTPASVKTPLETTKPVKQPYWQ